MPSSSAARCHWFTGSVGRRGRRRVGKELLDGGDHGGRFAREAPVETISIRGRGGCASVRRHSRAHISAASRITRAVSEIPVFDADAVFDAVPAVAAVERTRDAFLAPPRR